MDINSSLAPILSSVVVSVCAIGLLWLQKKLHVRLDNHHRDIKQTIAMSSQGSVQQSPRDLEKGTEKK